MFLLFKLTTDSFLTSVPTSGAASGGTLATVLSFFDMFSLKEIAAANNPYCISPVPNPAAASRSRPIARYGMLSTYRQIITAALIVADRHAVRTDDSAPAERRR